MKLSEFVSPFERMFELQQRINQVTHVCPEDYALASKLVNFIFDDNPSKVLEIVPLIFRSIRNDFEKQNLFPTNTSENYEYEFSKQKRGNLY